MKQALGLIETIGLAAAIEAADAAVKAANVTLLGYENTRGSGKITVKIAGNVGAVKAGVAAGVAAASRVGKVYGQSVIPRPHEEIDVLINNLDRGRKRSKPEAVENEPEPVVEEPEPEAEAPAEASLVVKESAADEVEAEASPGVEEAATDEMVADEKPEPRQCAAITKSGSRCKLRAQPGSDYCHVHSEPDA